MSKGARHNGSRGPIAYTLRAVTRSNRNALEISTSAMGTSATTAEKIENGRSCAFAVVMSNQASQSKRTPDAKAVSTTSSRRNRPSTGVLANRTPRITSNPRPRCHPVLGDVVLGKAHLEIDDPGHQQGGADCHEGDAVSSRTGQVVTARENLGRRSGQAPDELASLIG